MLLKLRNDLKGRFLVVVEGWRGYLFGLLKGLEVATFIVHSLIL